MPTFGYSGTGLRGLTVQGGIQWLSGRSGVLVIARADGDDDFRLDRNGQPQWKVHCQIGARGDEHPAARFTCLYEPTSRDRPALSLALAAGLFEPLKGIFFSAAGPWHVEGTRQLQIGAYVPETVGYALRRVGDTEPAVFVDQTRRPEILMMPGVTPTELDALAPFLLTLAQMRDARYVFRNQSGTLKTSDHPTVLPVPAESQARTPHEQHAASLIEMGEPDAARALAHALTTMSR